MSEVLNLDLRNDQSVSFHECFTCYRLVLENKRAESAQAQKEDESPPSTKVIFPWWNRNKGPLPPVLSAARLHFQLITSSGTMEPFIKKRHNESKKIEAALWSQKTCWCFGQTKKLADVQLKQRSCSVPFSESQTLQPFPVGYFTLMGLLRLGLVKRSHSMPAMAMPTQSQVKKLKRLMTEKMSCEMAYIMDSRHWHEGNGDNIGLVLHTAYNRKHVVLYGLFEDFSSVLNVKCWYEQSTTINHHISFTTFRKKNLCDLWYKRILV